MRAGYMADALDYTVDERTLADLTQFNQLLAMGLDPVTGKGHGRLTALEFYLERTRVDHPSDPRSGQTVALQTRHAAPWLGGSYRFDEVQIEGRVYMPLGERYVWANRARIGTILSEPTAAVPVSERYFLGGSANMRGWGRYQVAPLTTDGLPLGGRAMLDLSTEIRVPLRGSFGGVIFLDAGNVWTTPGEISVTDLYYAAGPGLRWMSPVGVVRADFAYQLKRIPGLRIDGEPERLRWRIHFSIGHTF
jgi:outer membrane translocation and assembly module TamA